MDRYFDHAATTPVDPHVRRAMSPFLDEAFGNPHSLHSLGRQAHDAVERARGHVATLIGAEDPSQIVFTSGATESNNWILGAFESVSVSPFEHSSVLEVAQALGANVFLNRGYALEPHSAELLSVMTVNNETGAILDLPAVGAASVHRDITQHVGKLPLDLAGVHFASFSSHKLYGPKGVGALYCQSNPIAPLLLGGDQELGARAGTLNVPAIVGFGEGARIAQDRMGADLDHVSQLRATLLGEIQGVADMRVHSHTQQSPYILSVSFLSVEGEPIVHDLDARGFQVSSGAACSSRSTEPSHVLSALGIEPEWLRGTIRISFGRANSCESARDLGHAIKETVDSVRNLRR